MFPKLPLLNPLYYILFHLPTPLILPYPRGIFRTNNSIDKPHHFLSYLIVPIQPQQKLITNEQYTDPVAMEVISGRRVSGLNPYAAPFVPVAYRAVEDYSPEWWQLMETTPWFRDYWFHECFLDPELVDNYESTFPDDVDSLFYPSQGGEEENESRERKDKTGEELVLWGLEKWRQSRGMAEVPRYVEKAPKFVNHRISPRTIHQPK